MPSPDLLMNVATDLLKKSLRLHADMRRLLIPLCLVMAVLSAYAEPSNATSCAAPEYHQFDFWIGDWDAFDAGSPSPSARTKVDRILDGCVLREDYQDVNGHKGQSFTIYDATRRVWHQTWVTNRGELLMIEGKRHGDEIVLSGADRTADGKERLVRGTWKPVSGGVREFAGRSLDGGKTWAQWFDITFRPHQ